jgi:fructokinase
MTSSPLLAGVELGGTKCICILGRGPDDIVETVELPTEQPDATLAAIRAVLDRWRYDALGIASFGPIDLDPASATFGSLLATPKPGWSGADLRGLTGDRPWTIDTDVNGAALAEGLWGAAGGLRSWAYITVGTGIGIGSIVEGRALRGLGHSEAGHMRIPAGADGWAGVCLFHGNCVEGQASGPAIAARAGRPGAEIAADDPVWGLTADALAALCHNLVLTTLPERILMGGGVGMGQPQLLPLIRAGLVSSLGGYGVAATLAERIDGYLVPPALGAMAGPLGALALARIALQTDAAQS